jgi:hypothetical protein
MAVDPPGRLRTDLPLVAISTRAGDSHAGPPHAPDLQEINTLGGYIAENIKKIDE